MNAAPATRSTRLDANQIRGFWAAWAGWALDGMDSFIYALVLVPALHDLLPRSNIAATNANVGFYGGILFAVFLVGWGASFVWGPIADRFGRVRVLMLTILCYSVFTFLGCIATNVWELGIFRFLAGVGIGGEWTLGSVFIAEEWPEDRRIQGACYMHTGYYFGTLLASALNSVVGARYGWRAMFVAGGTPALLTALIRYGVREPERWHAAARTQRALAQIFSREYRGRTLLNAAYLLISMVGLWAGSVYVPSAVTQLAARELHSVRSSAHLASGAAMLLSMGTILGCLVVPWLVARLGRRAALACFYGVMAVFIPRGFGYAFYLPANAVVVFIACMFFVGVGGASFCVFTVWLPEQYRTECRASAFAFATSFGRFIAAGATFAVGAAVSHFGTLGLPVAFTAIAFIIGLIIVPAGKETLRLLD